MAPFKVMISAVALTAFTATGAYAQDHRTRDRGNQGQRATQADQARPREQARPRTAEPRRDQQTQPRAVQQPRAEQPRVEQAQPRSFERRDGRQTQVQPRVEVRGNPDYRNQARPDYRNQARPEYRNQARPDYRTEARPEYRSSDRAVPRTYATPRPYYNGRTYSYGSPRVIRPRFEQIVPYRPYVYRPSLRIGVYYGYDGSYPYGYTPDYYFNPIPGHLYGGLRITDAPRDAQVFADGYYVGIVDDFDGIFQHLNLEAGPHHIEINEPGLEPVAFDVEIQPGRTMTFRADPYMFQP